VDKKSSHREKSSLEIQLHDQNSKGEAGEIFRSFFWVCSRVIVEAKSQSFLIEKILKNVSDS
jgi:hypothetical protein